MRISIHAGHAPYSTGVNHGSYGAVGLLNESVENRIVKNHLVSLFKNAGHTVYDDTSDYAYTQNKNLSDIVRRCNSHSVDLVLSIHLDSGRKDFNGDGDTGGTTVYGYDNSKKDMGYNIASYISRNLGIRNRGFKTNSGLYVLRKTVAPALLIECCFVDDADDTKKWDARKCAEAIYTGITGMSVKQSEPVNNTSKTYRVGNAVKFASYYDTPDSPITEAKYTNGVQNGIITEVKEGHLNPYHIFGIGWCNAGDIQNDITNQIATLCLPYHIGDEVIISSHYRHYSDGFDKAVGINPYIRVKIDEVYLGQRNPYYNKAFGTFFNNGDVRQKV